jgi:hypothetical protein
MNQHEQDSAEGFAELLDAAGVVISFGSVRFRALVRSLSAESDSFDLSRGDDDAVTVTALASELPVLPKPGDTFTTPDGWTYRVRKLIRTTGAVLVHFECGESGRIS